MKLYCACGLPLFVDTSDDVKAWEKITFAQSFKCDHPENNGAGKTGRHNFNIWGHEQ